MGTFVLVANHVSDLDPSLLTAAMSWRRMRRLYWAGDIARLFARDWQRVVARAIHIFPVDERPPAATMGNARTVLQSGSAIGWFPESWRSPTGQLQRFLPGIGLILAETPVTVVPAYILGAFEALPRTLAWPRPHPIRVIFGKPIPAESIRQLAGEADGPQLIVNMLYDHVAALQLAAQAVVSKPSQKD